MNQHFGSAEAVVFDWDGTLVDSQTTYVASWRAALLSVGCSPTREDLNYVVGRAFPNSLEYFAARIPIGREDFEHLWRADFRGRSETGLTTFSDAVACARACKQHNIPLAIATQTPRPELERALVLSGLHDITEITVSRTDVRYPKPAPDLYLEACRRLAISPDKCLAIEDSPIGVDSARTAGLFVWGIARSATAFAALTGVADMVTHTLDPKELIRMCGISEDEK